jgi:hypothetical protein
MVATLDDARRRLSRSFREERSRPGVGAREGERWLGR